MSLSLPRLAFLSSFCDLYTSLFIAAASSAILCSAVTTFVASVPKPDMDGSTSRVSTLKPLLRTGPKYKRKNSPRYRILSPSKTCVLLGDVSLADTKLDCSMVAWATRVDWVWFELYKQISEVREPCVQISTFCTISRCDCAQNDAFWTYPLKRTCFLLIPDNEWLRWTMMMQDLQMIILVLLSVVYLIGAYTIQPVRILRLPSLKGAVLASPTLTIRPG